MLKLVRENFSRFFEVCKVKTISSFPRHGYNFVVTLPVGASNIDIRQRGYKGQVGDDNYLAVKDGRGRYLLNGQYVVSAMEKDITVRGGLLRYSGTTTAVETLQATRPLQEALTVEVLSVGKMTPPRIRYSYYVPKENKEERTLKKETRVHAQNSVLVDSNKVELKKPQTRVTYKWTVGAWEVCSASCGSGLQRRLVQCLDPLGKPAYTCDQAQRPGAMQACGDPCPVWNIGEWSHCSKTCGKGFRRRVLRCVTEKTGLLLPRDRCGRQRKPQELDFCVTRPC